MIAEESDAEVSECGVPEHRNSDHNSSDRNNSDHSAKDMRKALLGLRQDLMRMLDQLSAHARESQ